jgi:hypothetical protein
MRLPINIVVLLPKSLEAKPPILTSQFLYTFSIKLFENKLPNGQQAIAQIMYIAAIKEFYI